MRWLVVVVAVSGCTYYTVAPDEARRVAAMSREQRESTLVDAERDNGKAVKITPARLKLVEPWHEGQPMYLRRPPHAALISGIVIVVAGLALCRERALWARRSMTHAPAAATSAD